MNKRVYVVNVFADGPHGGNPAPIVIEADGMSDTEMQEVARRFGHESGFVLPAPQGSNCDLALRFWVPNHEMEMCGHATVGAVWLLNHLGRLPNDRVSIWTKSGRVEARTACLSGGCSRVEITQPKGEVALLRDAESAKAEILSVLGISLNELAPRPLQNASTSRVKTLIPLRSAAVLDGLRPDFRRIQEVCEWIGSTGLYPYSSADLGAQIFDARQFPKSSGYTEDAATGIAAAALAFGLLDIGLVKGDSQSIRIRQGRKMGRPSEIMLRFRLDDTGEVQGCWIGGRAELEKSPSTCLGASYEPRLDPPASHPRKRRA